MAPTFKNTDYSSPSTSESTSSSSEDTDMRPEEYIMWIVHAYCLCKAGGCELFNCQQIHRVITHLGKCDRRPRGPCHICQQFISLCYHHVKSCKVEPACRMPFCTDIRENVQRRETTPRFRDTYKQLGLQQVPLPESLRRKVLILLSSVAKPGNQEMDSSVQRLLNDMTTSYEPEPRPEINIRERVASLFTPMSTDSPFAHDSKCTCALCWRVYDAHARFLTQY